MKGQQLETYAEIVPLRRNRSVIARPAAPVLDLSGNGLPTEHPVGAYLASLTSMNSRQSMQKALAMALCAFEEGKQLAEVDDEASRYYHQQVWRVAWGATRRSWMLSLHMRLQEAGYKSSSRRQIVSAVRRVLRECRLMDLIDADAYFKCTEGLPSIKNDSPPAGRAVELAEIIEILRFCDADENRARGIRDAAILTLGWSCGPRASEFVKLTVGDFSPKSEILKILNSKHGKSREVPITGEAKDRLEAWLDVRGRKPGRIFVRVESSGRVRIRSYKTGVRRLKPLIRPDAIGRIVQRRVFEARLLEPFTVHDLRRTAATEISRDSGIELAKDLLGHASIETTDRYRRLDQTELREAMAYRDQRLRGALEEEPSE